MKKKLQVLLLDHRDDGLAVVVARCLKRAGAYKVHCISSIKDHDLTIALHCRLQHDRLDSAENMLTAVERYHAKFPIDIVMPVHETAIKLAAEIAPELNRFTRLALCPSADLCSRIDNKWHFHELMTSFDIRVPRCILPDRDPERLTDQLSNWTFPVMIKPHHGKGGYGIRKCNGIDEVLAALDAAPDDEPMLIQEFIPGTDMGCSFISHQGRIAAHTIQQTMIHQNQSYTSGLGIRFRKNEVISGMIADFARKSNWSGVGNMDLRIDERTGNVYVLELNPRYWQTLLGSLAMGINFPDMHCRLTMDHDIQTVNLREGDWINLHMVGYDLTNLRNLKPGSWGLLFNICLREFVTEPLMEAYFFSHGLRQYLHGKYSRLKHRLIPSS
ncbi:MAG: ATP-grasp domain-containing protein [Pontiellaceae bacterium]|nr:ATP-grasp domain-containing protein [Pontiellaceae bacterium]MBN2786114.1 ATP-grasp domain-containing protein [Pontiellaceae bacterium]